MSGSNNKPVLKIKWEDIVWPPGWTHVQDPDNPNRLLILDIIGKKVGSVTFYQGGEKERKLAQIRALQGES